MKESCQEKPPLVEVRNDLFKGHFYDQSTREPTALITKEGDL